MHYDVNRFRIFHWQWHCAVEIIWKKGDIIDVRESAVRCIAGSIQTRLSSVESRPRELEGESLRGLVGLSQSVCG